MVPLNSSGPRETFKKVSCCKVGANKPLPLRETHPSLKPPPHARARTHILQAALAATQQGGNVIMDNYTIKMEAEKGQCGADSSSATSAQHPPPSAQPGPGGTALPCKAGKESENRFLFFHRVLGIYRQGRSGSFHPGHPARTEPRASLGPTWCISRLGQPALFEVLG